MKKYFLPFLIVTSLLVAACVAPPPQAPVSPTTAPSPVAETPAPDTAASSQATEGAIVDPVPPATETAPVEAGAIPVKSLRNATYSGVYDQPITLTDGLYEGEPYVEGDPSHPTVETIDGVELTGDLDGDGLEDAVVFLVESGGGSGSFVYVAAQLNRDGQPVDAGAVLIEDRVQIKSAAIDAGQVLVEAIVPGPGDGACCPSHRANKLYALQNGMLAEVAPEGGDLVKVSAADLDGTAWTLTELAEGQPVLKDTEITIRFEDGAIAGSAGCNTYTSAYSLSEDNPFLITLEPMIATHMACDDPVMDQETAYLSALETVTIWGYRIGDLALRYSAADGTPALMTFAPVAANTMADDGTMALAPAGE